MKADLKSSDEIGVSDQRSSGENPKDQVLARLEATDYENSVCVAEAGLKQAQVELSLATLNLERKRSLLKRRSISQAEFDTDEASEVVAEAKLRSAEAF